MSYYVHEVPGRLRIKIPEVKGNPGLAAEVKCFVTHVSGVASATVNTLTGSVVITYDPEIISAKEILRFLTDEGYLDIVRALSGKAKPADPLANAGAAVSKALFGAVIDRALEGTKFALLAALI
jgi:copper chaperone CopZ